MNLKRHVLMTMVMMGYLSVLNMHAYAEDAPLSLTAAQQRAIERSRQLAAQDAAVNANRELAVSAGQLPDPMLKMGVDNLPVDGADRFTLGRDFMTQRYVGISQEFTRTEKRELKAKLYEGEAEKNLAEKSVAIAAIQRDTALAWLERYYAEANANVIGTQIDAVKLEIAAAETAYRSGRGSQADVFAAYLALAYLEDRMSEAKQRIRNATVSLARWVGDDADKPLADKPDIDTLHLDTAKLDATLAHHPRIAVLNKQEQIAETEAQLAQANKKSDWSVEVAYALRGSPYSNMVSVGVSVPLQWDQKNRQDRELAAKLAQVEQVKAERDELLREHTTEIANLAAEWRNSRERLSRYTNDIIPLTTERTRATAVAYQTGKGSLADLMAARHSEVETRQQALQLETEVAKRWAELDFLIPASEAGSHHDDH